MQAPVLGRARRADPLRPLRPHEDIPMPVTPIIGVQAEETGNRSQVRNAIQLILAGHLAVDDYVTGILAGMLLLRRLESVQNIVDGRIAVAMDRHLPAVLMQVRDNFQQPLTGENGIAAIAFIALERYVVGLAQVTGVALDRAVLEKLGRAPADGVARHHIERGGAGGNFQRIFPIGKAENAQGQQAASGAFLQRPHLGLVRGGVLGRGHALR